MTVQSRTVEMHPNRYFAYTANNIPALIRYRFMTLTCLVGRHSGRENGSVRVCLQDHLYEFNLTAKLLAARLCILFTQSNFGGSNFLPR